MRRDRRLVVKVDRSGLNEHHPLVQKLYAAIDRVLKPIVAEEERRAGVHLIGTARAMIARDQVGLRALKNDALKAAFDHPGEAAAASPAARPRAPRQTNTGWETVEPDGPDETDEREAAEPAASPVVAALSSAVPIRMHPGEQRTITIHANPDQVPAGTQLQVDTDPGLSLSLRSTEFLRARERAGFPRSPGAFARR